MATREGRFDTGTARAERAVVELGAELRAARVDRGLSQAVVAKAGRMCRSKLSRIERGRFRTVPVLDLFRLSSILGLELSMRAYPGGQPIRDAAQRALLERFRARISPAIPWRYEVALQRQGDQRAWDAWLLPKPAVAAVGAMLAVAVEAETRPGDLQATQRRINLKLRDDPRVAAVILLLADTRRNRALVREHSAALQAEYPVAAAELLTDLAAGLRPRGSGVVLM